MSQALASPVDESTHPIVNIAAYLFTPLDRLDERREELRTLCKEQSLKGTILLSPEGINLFMAGPRASVDGLLCHLRSDPLMSALEAKESLSEDQPFNRLLVKIKKEIIAFGVEGVEPARYTSKKLPAAELKRWLDEGRPLTLLDTRNDYEVDLGTFDDALPIGVDHFRDFPEAVRKLPEEMKDQPIVMFCTGGIRCEKAGPFMEQEGFREIYQLEGGILKYFEECGGDHYHGDCFVFDRRVAVNPNLEETATTQCYACQHPLTADDQNSVKYEFGQSCPYCWKPKVEATDWTTAEAEQAIRAAATPLPGCESYTNYRPLNVPARYDRWTLIDFLCDYHPHITRDEWLAVCADELVRSRNNVVVPEAIVRGGQRLYRLEPDTVEPPVNADIEVIAWEPDYVVLSKPAPLPMHPCGRFNRNSLTSILQSAFPDEYLSPAHRLDANTTGLVVFSRSRRAARKLQPQFESFDVSKVYLCRVKGVPDWSETSSTQPISSQPAEGGFRLVDEENGLPAETAFRFVKTFANGESLIEARPKTGRTNQIRVHLWDLGLPIVGDPVYLPDGGLGESQTSTVDDPPMCLHAWKLSFTVPGDENMRTFEAPRPAWSE